MKTILLTGASGGIGSTIRTELENAGHTVIPVSHADADLTSPPAIESLAAKVGKPDWIVCAHGYIDTAPTMREQSVEAIQNTFAVNTLSVAYLARQFPQSDMIALSSTAALHVNGKYPAYSASKAALNVLMQNLAKAHAERQYITVCPGATNTQMREKIAHDAAKHQDPNVVADLVNTIIGEEGDYKSGDIISVRDGATEIVSRIS